MSLSRDEVRRLMDEFERRYFSVMPHSGLLRSCGVLKVHEVDRQASEEERNDYCIMVFLHDPLPAEPILPEIYEGVRVYTHVIGNRRII